MSGVAGTLVRKEYGNFRGVDFSSMSYEVSPYRSPDALNVWKNYKNASGKGIETRPDVELLEEYSNTIFGLFFYTYNGEQHRIVHSGTDLYDDDNVIFSNMAETNSKFFVFNNLLYIKDGINYLVYDGTDIGQVEGYIPTTTISRGAAGGGTIYEDVNMLSPYRKNGFCADGESTSYALDSQSIDDDYVPKVWIDDELVDENDYSVDYSNGYIVFDTAPSEPLTVGQDNIIVQYKKEVPGYADRINNCTLLEVFDNRIFFSGNADYPNLVWHCSLNDPTYCSDLDYYEEGTDNSPVKALVAGNNALWVMKAPSQANTTIFYHNPTIDSDYGKIYPSSHSSISTGCVSTGINFNDTICFFSDRGLEAITGDVTTEQVLSHKSTFVDSKLLNETNYKEVLLQEWEGYLLAIIDNRVYLADSRQMATINDHYEYEWYYFEFKQKITSTQVKDGVLYLCTEEQVKENGSLVTKYRVYTLTGNSATRQINAYWTTLADEFGYPGYQKITNKKGCEINMEGKSIEVYAKTDNKPFDLINKYVNTKGFVVAKIKKKKWKSIQLKFSSILPFNLVSFTLESYVGSYLKR